MTHVWIWLSELFVNIGFLFEHWAIRKEVLDAYQVAIRNPTEENLNVAIRLLTEASARLGHDNSAANTVGRCYRQVEGLMRGKSSAQPVVDSGYAFDPEKYGFRKMPPMFNETWGCGEKWYKVTNKSENTIWFTVCHRTTQDHRDQRWTILKSGAYIGPPGFEMNSGYVVYMGCISSQEFAEQLLSHAMGNSDNKGIAEGRKRLEAEFIEYL